MIPPPTLNDSSNTVYSGTSRSPADIILVLVLGKAFR
jgi:hypothetical protein